MSTTDKFNKTNTLNKKDITLDTDDNNNININRKDNLNDKAIDFSLISFYNFDNEECSNDDSSALEDIINLNNNITLNKNANTDNLNNIDNTDNLDKNKNLDKNIFNNEELDILAKYSEIIQKEYFNNKSNNIDNLNKKNLDKNNNLDNINNLNNNNLDNINNLDNNNLNNNNLEDSLEYSFLHDKILNTKLEEDLSLLSLNNNINNLDISNTNLDTKNLYNLNFVVELFQSLSSKLETLTNKNNNINKNINNRLTSVDSLFVEEVYQLLNCGMYEDAMKVVKYKRYGLRCIEDLKNFNLYSNNNSNNNNNINNLDNNNNTINNLDINNLENFEKLIIKSFYKSQSFTNTLHQSLSLLNNISESFNTVNNLLNKLKNGNIKCTMCSCMENEIIVYKKFVNDIENLDTINNNINSNNLDNSNSNNLDNSNSNNLDNSNINNLDNLLIKLKTQKLTNTNILQKLSTITTDNEKMKKENVFLKNELYRIFKMNKYYKYVINNFKLNLGNTDNTNFNNTNFKNLGNVNINVTLTILELKTKIELLKNKIKLEKNENKKNNLKNILTDYEKRLADFLKYK